MFATGDQSEEPTKSVTVTMIQSTRDNLCYLWKSSVMCFLDQKVKRIVRLGVEACETAKEKGQYNLNKNYIPFLNSTVCKRTV